jgi:hypothetical protein
VASPAGLTTLHVRHGFLLMALYGGVYPVMAFSAFEPDLAHMDIMAAHDVRSPRHMENDVPSANLAPAASGQNQHRHNHGQNEPFHSPTCFGM